MATRRELLLMVGWLACHKKLLTKTRSRVLRLAEYLRLKLV